MNNINVISEAKQLFDTEIEAMELVKNSLDERFVKIVSLIVNCKGKVVITGMGKPGHIGAKIAATLASLGTSSFFLHPAEALHGDLGMIQSKDIVIAMSYSGESEEVTRIIPNIKVIGATLIAISSNADSTLVKHSDYSYIFPYFKEACPLNLAPTSSTTVTLAFGDALAVCASLVYGFNKDNFALFHPGGVLGKKLLLSVSDLMKMGEENAVVKAGSSLKDAIVEMSTKALGIINIIDSSKMIGVFTDGDLRRILSKGVDVYHIKIDDVMSKIPYSIEPNKLAIEALKFMNDKNISALPVIENSKLVGTIRINDITGAGVIL